jgi:riboflavin kinase/FMN adenylyltransferase
MVIVENVQQNEAAFDNVVLTVGSFDGVHKGHQAILEQVVQKAKEIDGTPAILTMNPHPREFFAPDNAPNLLTSFDKKAALLEELGIEILFVLHFDQATADMTPEDFIQNILHEKCQAAHIIVGHDCHFGKGAKGDFEMLRTWGEKLGFEVEEISQVIIEAERVSSTLIRERVLQGDLETVRKLLGRPYSVTGTVSRGRGIGEQLGFPTANVQPDHSAIPAQGVYFAETVVDGVAMPSAVNIGIAPTIRHADVTIETHILEFKDDIRGKEIEVVFYERIRPEKKFPSKEALIEQIAADVSSAKSYFGI